MATCIASEEHNKINFKAHLTPDCIPRSHMIMAIIAKGNIIEGIEAKY